MSYVSTDVQFIPQDDFEVITQKILRNANYDLSGNTIKAVPVEEIIEFDFELNLLWEDISYLEDNTSDVYALIVPEKRMIIMNEAKKDFFEKVIGPRNFTYAHELGHFVLHTSEGRQLSLFEDTKFLCRAEDKYDPVEYQANQFASCLLMPKPLIETTISHLIETNSLKWRALYGLADNLEVSITALILRLKKLNLVQIDDNKSIIPLKGASEGQIHFDL